MPLAPPFTKGLMVDHTVALFASVIPAKDDSCCSGQKHCRCTFVVIFMHLALKEAITCMKLHHHT
jgi:hypothetical protein